MLVLGCIAVATGDDASKGKWLPMSDGIISTLEADHLKPGYPGGAAGVAVDHASGAVYVVICDQGIWRSADHGATFIRVDKKVIGGRCETGFALDADPAGSRLMCFMIYGPSGMTMDGGNAWSSSTLSHLDFGAVDWSDATAKTMISVKHESGGEGVLSRDAGKSWSSLGKGFKAVGIFPGGILMGDKGAGLVRSEDGGMTWASVSNLKTTGLAMRVDSKGVGYWTSDAGVLVSTDAGRTWPLLGSPVKAYYGPYFGEKQGHLLVVGERGLCETADAGTTWQVVAPLPPDFKVGFTGPNFGWEVAAGIFYASSMGKPAYRYLR
jgi:hypothetical protein